MGPILAMIDFFLSCVAQLHTLLYSLLEPRVWKERPGMRVSEQTLHADIPKRMGRN